MLSPRLPLMARRPRWYAVHSILARLLLVWVMVIVVLTPSVPVPATREPQRAILRNAWAITAAAAAVGVILALREQRRSIRRQYAISTAACIAALLVGLIGYPRRPPGPPPVRPASAPAARPARS